MSVGRSLGMSVCLQLSSFRSILLAQIEAYSSRSSFSSSSSNCSSSSSSSSSHVVSFDRSSIGRNFCWLVGLLIHNEFLE